MGATLPLQLTAPKRWFDDFDGVIRINTDVLIRDSDWIWETMKVV
jgi:hypothetical protein